jgi:hypothetical protein
MGTLPLDGFAQGGCCGDVSSSSIGHKSLDLGSRYLFSQDKDFSFLRRHGVSSGIMATAMAMSIHG